METFQPVHEEFVGIQNCKWFVVERAIPYRVLVFVHREYLPHLRNLRSHLGLSDSVMETESTQKTIASATFQELEDWKFV